jgi:hypothetical protein
VARTARGCGMAVVPAPLAGAGTTVSADADAPAPDQHPRWPGAGCSRRWRQKLESQLSLKAPPGEGITVGQAFAWLVVSSVPGGADWPTQAR